ncbi:hypothetical protein J6O48_03395 [bacterium]|nr:hypothetical protein [bacterium]
MKEKHIEEKPVDMNDTLEPEVMEEYSIDSIEPEDIVFDDNSEDDDSDMPIPQTKDYVQMLRCKPLFIELFNEAIGHMPYASILKNQNNEQIKLIDLVRYVEAKKDSMEITEMDKVISFIANLDFKYARKLMEKIENQSQQKELFEIIQS